MPVVAVINTVFGYSLFGAYSHREKHRYMMLHLKIEWKLELILGMGVPS